MSRNLPDGDFLQSAQWLRFQEIFGRKTTSIEGQGFLANCVEHRLPIVGGYWYVPRGPVIESCAEETKHKLVELLGTAKENNVGWIRIEPASEEALNIVRRGIDNKVIKAPYDVQPREIFVLDIAREETVLLEEMKSKTRYNIGVAKKKGVAVRTMHVEGLETFWALTKEMALRQGITPHPEEYYRKMFEVFSPEILKLYVAEFGGKIIAANLVLFYGKVATYLHGASSNENRNVMATYLLQWQAILDAKKSGCTKYDFGGVKTRNFSGKSWEGITNFKLGFSPNTNPVVFPGTYDIIVNPRKYAMYRGLQRAKLVIKKFRR